RDEECAALLAIPFADGLRITLTNGSTQTLQGVGIDAAIDRRPSACESHARLRVASLELHGGGAEVEMAGAGRLAGVVAEVGTHEPTVLSLTPDHEEAPSYKLFWPPAAVGKSALSGWSEGLAWEWTLLAAPAWQAGCRIASDLSDAEPVSLHVFYYEDLPSVSTTN
ncbi:MAG: hypothetical protein KDA61_04485, partial [Planctomycetales bacterium]|nr:hypothetical protein [Planctomycetales bacterium]